MIPDTSVISYQSKIDSSYTVFIVYKEYEHYDVVKEMLNRNGESIAALQIGTKNIYIDGEVISDDTYTEDHLLAIEAHEIAHGRLKHKAGYDELSEFEADTYGVALLIGLSYDRAAELLGERIQQYVDNYYK